MPHSRLVSPRTRRLPVMGLLMGVSTVVVLWVGGGDVMGGRMSIGDLVAFNAYVMMLSWPLIASVRSLVGAVVGGWLLRRTNAGVLTAVGMLAASGSFLVMGQWGAHSLDGFASNVPLVVGGFGFGLLQIGFDVGFDVGCAGHVWRNRFSGVDVFLFLAAGGRGQRADSRARGGTDL